MANALLAGVSGIKSHQKMIDVAGNNLANLSTSAFKASRVTFAEMMSETIAEASQPTSDRGGINPMQIGSGVALASIDRNMTQGSMITTGNPLDMMIEGEGYFVLNDGSMDVYSRVGRFAVDSAYCLVDPNTGYRVQRIGSEGVDEGFQSAGDNSIRVPYDVSLPAAPTTEMSYTGNLSASDDNLKAQILTSGLSYTTIGTQASTTTKLMDMDQFDSFVGSLEITGYDSDGTSRSVTLPISTAAGTETNLQDIADAINTTWTGATASIMNGQIRVIDDVAGYGKTDLMIAPDALATGTFETPNFFQIIEPGGLASRTTNIEVFDSQGMSHIMSAAFVKSDTNKWDMVITNMTGDVKMTDRRIEGITFNADSSYAGMDSVIADEQSFQIEYAYDGYNTRMISIDLGDIGQFNGLSQSGGSSTVSPANQNGYTAGSLSSVSVTREGTLVGVFTNNVRKDICSLQVATFQNPAALEAIGASYFQSSGNSGIPIPTRSQEGGAGTIVGGGLEGSNTDVASEFVNLIQAQNGYQANARTIKVSNDMLEELTNLIR